MIIIIELRKGTINMRKNFRLSETEARDLEVINFLEGARNESELIKNALIFYKKAIEKNVIFDTNIKNDDMWDNIFETAVPLQLIKEDREKVKEKLIKQKKREEKQRMKELTAVENPVDNVDNVTDSNDDRVDEIKIEYDNTDKEVLTIDDIIEDLEGM